MVPEAGVASIPAQSSAAIVTKDHHTVTANSFMKPATSCSGQQCTCTSYYSWTEYIQNTEQVHRF